MLSHLISIDDLPKEEILSLLALAARVEATPRRDLFRRLEGVILATLFFEPSTRTRLSFETAMARLGGRTVGFSEATASSTAKGESFSDTIRTVARYADVIALRHPLEGTARRAAEVSRKPIVNGGDGANQHPTQTLLDLYTLRKCFGRLEGLDIAIAGDLKYSRTVHSLLKALARFDGIKVRLISPKSLRLADGLAQGLRTEETESLAEGLRGADVLYMTRIQRERFPDPLEYEKVKNVYRLDAAMLKGMPDTFRVLHPLPRVSEIAPDVDETPYAAYFDQAENGVLMREAIFLKLLDPEFRDA
jgi:aspartate carbamoyltransferase catalytic subunit